MLDALKRPEGSKKRKKVVGRGRGSGHGKTSGRGEKGQNARASGGVRPGFEGGQMPLIRRIPKRGFTFTPKPRYSIVALERLNEFPAGSEVTVDALKKARMVQSDQVKVLGDGELKHALTVKVHAYSKSAQEKIQKAGGKAEVLGAVAQPVAEKSKAAEKSKKGGKA